MKEKKERLDVLLVDNGFFDSREKAKRAIMAGLVFVNGEKEDKAGSSFPLTAEIVVKGNPLPYVSRGGLKLEKALKAFPIDLKERICMDIGASTGGFTDCMLQNGAKEVYSVDVGHGQLDWKLRNDARVHVMEKCNIRYVEEKDLGEKPSFFSIDVSFISLKLVLPVVKRLASLPAELVCLIKPQFEAGREQVGKKGVVRDPKVHEEVICAVLEFALRLGFSVEGLSFSPIKGPEGNIEYLAYLRYEGEEKSIESGEEKSAEAAFLSAELLHTIEQVTEESHRAL